MGKSLHTNIVTDQKIQYPRQWRRKNNTKIHVCIIGRMKNNSNCSPTACFTKKTEYAPYTAKAIAFFQICINNVKKRRSNRHLQPLLRLADRKKEVNSCSTGKTTFCRFAWSRAKNSDSIFHRLVVFTWKQRDGRARGTCQLPPPHFQHQHNEARWRVRVCDLVQHQVRSRGEVTDTYYSLQAFQHCVYFISLI